MKNPDYDPDDADRMAEQHRRRGTTIDDVWECLPPSQRPGPQGDMRTWRSDIPAILAATDVVSLVKESGVDLRKAGKDYQACCPFHDEKTPSFTVSPEKQFYHCFGCGAHGDALDWIQEYHRLDFRQALQELAGRAGIGLPAEDHGAARKRRAVRMQAEIEAAVWEELCHLERAISERVSYRTIDARARALFPHIKPVSEAPSDGERLAAQRAVTALYALYGVKP